MGLLRSFLAVLALCACLAAAQAGPDVSVFTGKRVRAELAFSALRADLRPFRVLGSAIVLDEHELEVKRIKSGLMVALAPGRAPGTRVTGAKTVTVQIKLDGKFRKVDVHLRPVAEGKETGWEYAVVNAAEFEIDGREILLVDSSGDGRFRVGEDAYTTPGEPMLLPLGESLIVGRRRVVIESLADDGTRLSGEVRDLAGKRDQLEALVVLNDFRAQFGLPPVVVDPQLSAACTAHAEYLRKNGWNGFTNPHGEAKGRPGFSAEGHRAAMSSAIMRGGNVTAIQAHWLTYYHRIAFVNPRLERVGISSGVGYISVIDGKSGVPSTVPGPTDIEAEFEDEDEDEIDEDPWDDPLLMPPDGSIRFPTFFCKAGESPAPVPQPAGRGNPLMILFPANGPPITDFKGELVELKKGKERPVETLVPKPLGGRSNVFGLIPARPLRGGAIYRVTYTFQRDFEPESATATFQTP